MTHEISSSPIVPTMKEKESMGLKKSKGVHENVGGKKLKGRDVVIF